MNCIKFVNDASIMKVVTIEGEVVCAVFDIEKSPHRPKYTGLWPGSAAYNIKILHTTKSAEYT